jgi:hypothetical protein
MSISETAELFGNLITPNGIIRHFIVGLLIEAEEVRKLVFQFESHVQKGLTNQFKN